jgi:hypothetical protein
MPKRIIQVGNKIMEIDISIPNADAYGSVTELQLKHGSREFNIRGVKDGTIIRTHDSRSCAWYFIGGLWYYICG